VSLVTATKASVRETLKRSRTIHSAYKIVHRFHEVPVAYWLDVRRTRSIFRVLPNTMLPAPRLVNAYNVMEEIEQRGLAGAVVECGVWAGGGIGLMASVSKAHRNRSRVFHLFDSFEGLPQPSTEDVDVVDVFRAQHPELDVADGAEASALTAIGACAAPLEDVNELFFGALKIDRSQVRIHQGWFQETVPGAVSAIGPVAVLRIDGDWYESTKICLEQLYGSVVDGGFVIIDDYGTFVGCAQAVDEFLAARAPDVRLIDIDGEGVYFRKTATRSPENSVL
jgi:O-methyltransferase